MAILQESSSVVIYDDPSSNSNPQYQLANWRRQLQNVSVKNPLNEKFVLQPNTAQTVFSGSRTTTIDNTTTFAVTLNPVYANVYRFAVTGGTAAGFRTDRGLNLTSDTVVWAVNNNATATVTITTNNFSSVLVGDQVWIPGATTGDASLSSPFNTLNQGLWTVIGKASGGTPKTITLTRLPGTPFSGVAETQSPTAAAQFVAFSSSGVQVGDSLEISNGFSTVSQINYTVFNVISTFVEVTSTLNIPLETRYCSN